MMGQFKNQHLVQFYETGLMGVIHHSNYLRIFEEARVAWAHSVGLIDYQKPESASYFAVIETQVRHIKPGKFGDLLITYVQARLEGIRIIFEYKLLREQELIAEGRTIHASLSKDLKLLRPPPQLKEIMEKQSWTETWLSNL